MELLLTYPVRDGAVLLGKFLAAFALYAIMLVLTLVYPGPALLLRAPGVGADPHGLPRAPPARRGAFIAVGLFASSLTENQIVAAMTTFGVLLLFWVIGWTAETWRGGGSGCSRTCRSSSTSTTSPRACSTRGTSSTT